jgi:hypothetical protein
VADPQCWAGFVVVGNKECGTNMIPLYCIVDRKQIPEERVRRGAKTCDKECQRLYRRAFLLDRKERYRKAAGFPLSQKSTSGQRNSVPDAIYAAGSLATEITEHQAISVPPAVG